MWKWKAGSSPLRCLRRREEVGHTEIYEHTQEQDIVHLAKGLIPIGSLLLLAIHNTFSHRKRAI